jgi:hypothetical protein
VQIHVADDRLVIVSEGSDPHVHGPPITVAPPVDAVLRLKTRAAGHGELFWQTGEQRRYDAVTAAQFELIPDGEWHDYRVRLYEQDEIVRVRFDPGSSPGTSELASFRLEPIELPALPEPPTAARVVYFDPRYGACWVQAAARIAERLDTKGFTIVDAAQLAAWMRARAAAGAPGSVCVLAQDLFPDTVFESCRPQCTARRYMDAGGRVVQGGVFPFSHRGLPDGEERYAGAHAALLGERTDVPERPELTDEGRAFGLEHVAPSGNQLANAHEVTTVLARVGRFYAAAWLKTYAPAHPGSGLLRVRNARIDGASDAEIEELARVAVHALPGAG